MCDNQSRALAVCISYPNEGIRCGDGGGVFELLAAERIRHGRQSSAFGVSQAQAPVWEFGGENAIFFFEIRDDMLLMPIDPAGNHGDEGVENHEGSSGW